jgi:hypothetical protein
MSDSANSLSKIKHIVVLMLENRSTRRRASPSGCRKTDPPFNVAPSRFRRDLKAQDFIPRFDCHTSFHTELRTRYRPAPIL